MNDSDFAFGLKGWFNIFVRCALCARASHEQAVSARRRSNRPKSLVQIERTCAQHLGPQGLLWEGIELNPPVDIRFSPARAS